MAPKILNVLIVIFIFLFGISLVQATSHIALSCRVLEDGVGLPCSGAIFFRINDDFNAHSEIPSVDSYFYDVCCESPGFNIGNSCGTAIF